MKLNSAVRIPQLPIDRWEAQERKVQIELQVQGTVRWHKNMSLKETAREVCMVRDRGRAEPG